MAAREITSQAQFDEALKANTQGTNLSSFPVNLRSAKVLPYLIFGLTGLNHASQ